MHEIDKEFAPLSAWDELPLHQTVAPIDHGDQFVANGDPSFGVDGRANHPRIRDADGSAELLKFRDIDDVVRRANDTAYGLAASVWTNDLALGKKIATRLEAGTVWINHAHVFSPDIAFGGHKQSGIGIENSLHGLGEYANAQTVMRKPLAAA